MPIGFHVWIDDLNAFNTPMFDGFLRRPTLIRFGRINHTGSAGDDESYKHESCQPSRRILEESDADRRDDQDQNETEVKI